MRCVASSARCVCGGVLVLVSSLLFGSSGAAAWAALQEKPGAAADEISEKIAAVEAALKAKNGADVTSSVDLLMDRAKDAEKDHKRVADAIGRVLLSDLEAKVRSHAAQVLGELGPAGSLPLKKAAGLKEIKDESAAKELYKAVIDAVGKTADKGNVDLLRKLLKDKDNEIIAAAATSLKYYSKADGMVRKQIVDELVSLLEGCAGASRDGRNTAAIAKYEVVSQPMILTLQELTGERIGKPEEWRKWFNDNKKKKW